MSQFSNKELQEYAWQYFALHASQRMSLFNFFVASSSVVTAALCGTFHEKVRAYEMGIVLGFLLPVISFVFWKLDQRVSFLLKHAEAALKHLERQFIPQGQELTKLFTLEEELTNQKKEKRERTFRWVIRCHMTYSRCFRLIFLAFGLTGIIGVVMSLVYLSHNSSLN